MPLEKFDGTASRLSTGAPAAASLPGGDARLSTVKRIV